MEQIDKRSRDRLISKALELFRERGYHNITMDDIAAACNIKKASLYHHIPSRNELVVLALREEVDFFKSEILSRFYDNSLSIEERAAAYAEKVNAFYVKNMRGSFVGSLATEYLDDTPEVKAIVKEFYDEFFKGFAHLFEHKFESNKAVEMAEDVLAQIKGAIHIGYLHKTTKPFERAIARISQLIAD